MKKFRNSTFCTVVSIIILISHPLTIFAELPTGENVVAGSAAFDRSVTDVLSITTPSDKLIVNYQTFSIGTQNTVDFYQPSASSVALNRVVSGSPSEILGNLNANGQIFIVNLNGIIFGSNSHIDTAGLLASTLNISNEDFLNENYSFFADGGSAFIDNQGTVRVANGGFVTLLSGAINNSGSIEANLGSVVLATGEEITVALDDLNDISVVINKTVQQEIYDTNGQKVADAIKNSGSIVVDGGKAVLTAKVLDSIFDHAINNQGVVQANSLVSHDGVIELTAEGAPILNDGDLRAGTIKVGASDTNFINNGDIIADGLSSLLPNGGVIDISADNILHLGRITANAYEDGQAGKITIISVDTTTAGSGSVTEAKASGSVGLGGEVIFNSTSGSTLIAKDSLIDVSGGSDAGDAGFLEMSAYQSLGFYGSVIGKAAAGYEGASVLIDPRDITVETAGLDTPTSDIFPGADESTTDNVGDDLVIDPLALHAMVASEVFLEATRDFFLKSDLLLLDNAFRIEVGRHLKINANLSTQGQNIDLVADSDGNGSGTFSMLLGTSIVSNGGDVTISSADSVTIRTIDAGSGEVSLTTVDAGQDIKDDSDDTTKITAGILNLTSADEIGASGNRLDTNISTLNASAPNGSVYLTNDGSLTISSVTSNNDVAITASTGNLTVDEITATDDVTLTALAGSLEENPDGDVDISGDKLTVDVASGVGAVDGLELSVNSVDIDAGNGNLVIDNDKAITLTNASTTDGNIDIEADGQIIATVVNAAGTGDTVELTTTTGDIKVGSVTAVTSITLDSAGAIDENGSDGAADIDAPTVNLTSVGSIGDIKQPEIDADTINAHVTGTGNINISVISATVLNDIDTNNGSITVTANGNLTATDVDSSATDHDDNDITLITTGTERTLAIGVVDAGSLGDVTLTANGTDSVVTNAGLETVIGDELTVTAKAGIGAEGQALETNVNSLDASVTGAGDMFINENDAIVLTDVDTSNGSIDITAGGQITATDVRANGTGANVDLTATLGDIITGIIEATNDTATLASDAGSIVDDANDATVIKAGTADLTAVNGIGTAGEDIDLTATNLTADVTSAGIINVRETNGLNVTSATTADGDITITADAGNLNITTVTAGTNSDATLTATTGKILDATSDITANKLIATAGTGIGSSGTALGVTVSDLDASVTGNGGIWVSGTTAMTLSDVDTNNGDIVITADGTLTVTDVVSTTDSNGNDIVLTATSGNIEVGTINAGATAGDVDLEATTGSIVDDTSSITADNLALEAANGIGAGGAFLNTIVKSINATVTAIGGIWINETNAVTLNNVETADGSITVNADGDIIATTVTSLTDDNDNDISLTATSGNITLRDVDATGAGDITIDAQAGSILDDGSSENVAGDVLTLTAVTGIGNGGTDLDTAVNNINASTSGAGNIAIDQEGSVTLDSVTTANGSITINANGDLTATNVDSSATDHDDNDITLIASGSERTLAIGVVDAGSLGDVTLTSTGTDSVITDLGLNTVTADVLTVTAKAGIGTDEQALETDVNSLDASVTSVGDMYIDETDAIVLTNVDTNNGDIDITAGGQITATDVVAGGAGDIDLTATLGDIIAGVIDANGDTATLTSDAGSIVDDDNDATAVKAANVILSATATGQGIGTGESGTVDTNAVFLTLSADDGGINVRDVASVEISGATVAENGDVYIEADDALTLGATVATTGTGSVTLKANTDDAGGNHFIQSDGADVTTAGEDIIITVDGTGNARVRTINANGGNLSITSAGGDISEAASGESDLSANVLTLTAGDGSGDNIGTNGDALNTTATEIVASAGTGGIYIDEANGALLSSVTTANGGSIRVVSATGNLEVGTISAGAGVGDVTLTATDGNIVDATSSITGDDVRLSGSGTSGFVGTITDFITTIATKLHLTENGGGIYVNETDGADVNTLGLAGGDVVINNASGLLRTTVAVNSLGGDVTLTSAGDLTIGNNGADDIVTGGGAIILTADSDDAEGGTLTTISGVDITSNDANITLEGFNISLAANTDVVAGIGDITVAGRGQATMSLGYADGSSDIQFDDVELAKLQNTGEVTFGSLNTAAIILETLNNFSTQDLNIISNDTVTGEAPLGVDVEADDFYVYGKNGVTLITGVTTLDVETDNSNATITQDGSVALNDIDVGGGDFSLTLTSGAITDGNGATDNITAANATLNAVDGVGSGDALETTISGLTASNTDNNIEIDNTGALTLNGVTNTNGNVLISASSPLIVASAVTAGGAITLTSTNDGDDDDHITVNADVESTDGGKLTFNAGTDYIQNAGSVSTTGDVVIDAVRDAVQNGAGTLSADDANITAGGDITFGQANDVETLTTDATAAGDTTFNDVDDITLTSMTTADGAITVTADDDITVTSVTSTTDHDDNDISLTSTGGMIWLGEVDAGTESGDVTIVSDQIIFDNNGATNNITADEATLTANFSIGGAGAAAIDTTVNSLDASSELLGGVYINEADAIDLADVDTANGSISVTAGGTITATDVVSSTDNDANDIILEATGDINVGTINAGADGDVDLTASASVLDATSDITADELDISAGTGIGALASWLQTTVSDLIAEVTGTGDIYINETNAVTLVDVDTADGDINITSGGALTVEDVEAGGEDGNVNLVATTGNVILDQAIANGDKVTIEATAGAIVDDNGGTVNIVALDAELTASSGIGDEDAIETEVSNLSAANTTNDINIENDGELTITNFGEGNGVNNTTGNVNISASSPLNVNSDVVAGGTITLTSTNDGGSDDDLTVAADIQSTGGNEITLNAGYDLIQTAGAINTAGTVDINADNDVSQSGGQVLAGTLEVDAAGAIDLDQANDANNVDLSSTSAGNIVFNDTDDVVLTDVDTASGDITVTAAGQITATDVNAGTDGDVDISNTAGNILVGLVQADGDQVTLTSDVGAITDNNDGDNNVTADTLIASAATGIGAVANWLETAIGNLTASVTGTGGVYISETNAITLTDVDTADGDISIAAGGAIIATDVAATDGTVDLDAQGLITATLISATDSASTGDYDVDLYTTTGGMDLIDVTADNDVLAVADLGNITIDEITAGNEANIESTDGSITENGADEGADITAVTATLTAKTGIYATSPLETSIDNLEAHVTGTGNIEIANDKAIKLTDVDTVDGDIDITADNTITAVDVRAGGADGDVTLETTLDDILVKYIEATDTVTLTAEDDITEKGSDGAADIVATHLVATAEALIGKSGNRLETDVDTIEAHSTRTKGIYLSEEDAVTLVDVDTKKGKIDIVAGGTITAVDVESRNTNNNNGNDIVLKATSGGDILVGTITANGNADVKLLTPGGSILDNGSMITADDLNFDAKNGFGTSSDRINTDVNEIINGEIDAAGDIWINETDAIVLTDVDTKKGKIDILAGGKITAVDVESTNANDKNSNDIVLRATSGRILVGTITANGKADVELVSDSGSIRDDDSMITANDLDFVAKKGFGTEEARINTDVDEIVNGEIGGNGGIWISETDAIKLTDVDTNNGAINITAGGKITATDVESLTDDEDNGVTLTATDENIKVSWISANNVTLDAQNGSIVGQDVNEIDIDTTSLFLTADDKIYGKRELETYFGNETKDFLATNAESIEASAGNSIDIYDTGSVELVDVQTDFDFPDSITIVADGDIDVTYVYDPNHVTLEATEGSIIGQDDDDIDIDTSELYLYASDAIYGYRELETHFGNETNDFLTTNAESIEATAGNSIDIYDTDSVELVDVQTDGDFPDSITIVADGDIEVTYVSDPFDVTLEADGSIIGNENEGSANIDTTDLYLYATEDIYGDAEFEDAEFEHSYEASYLTTDVDTLEAEANNIYILEEGSEEGSIELVNVIGNGEESVVIIAEEGDIEVGYVTDSNDVTLEAHDGSIIGQDDEGEEVDIDTYELYLYANDSIYGNRELDTYFDNETNDFLVTNAESIEAIAGNSIDIYDTGSVELVNIRVDDESDDSITIVADGDIEVTYVSDPNHVTLEAQNGSIIGQDDDEVDIYTDELYLYADGNIYGNRELDTYFGNETNDFLVTDVNSIVAIADESIDIYNDGSVELWDVQAEGDDSVTIIADGDIDVTYVSDPNHVTLEAWDGSIVGQDDEGEEVDIDTDELYLYADGDIYGNRELETFFGNETNDFLVTNAYSIEAIADESIDIYDTGSVELEYVSADGDDSVTIVAEGYIEVYYVSDPNHVTLEARDGSIIGEEVGEVGEDDDGDEVNIDTENLYLYATDSIYGAEELDTYFDNETNDFLVTNADSIVAIADESIDIYDTGSVELEYVSADGDDSVTVVADGDINVYYVSDPNHVTLEAWDGSIVGQDDDEVDIDTDELYLYAYDDIYGNRGLDTFFGNESEDFLVTNANSIVAIADEVIDIYDTGSVELWYVETDGEDSDSINIVADGGIDVYYVSDPNHVTLEAQDGSIVGQDEYEVDIYTDELYLYADGDIYGNYDTESFFNEENNFLTTDVSSIVAIADEVIDIYNDGSVELWYVETDGEFSESVNIVADGDIDVYYVSDPNHVTLEAWEGSITGQDREEVDVDINTEELYLYANDSIYGNRELDTYFGNETEDFLVTNADSIEAMAGDSIDIYDTGSVELWDVQAEGDDSVTIIADGDIDVTYVSDPNHVTLEAWDGSIIGQDEEEIDIDTDELYLYADGNIYGNRELETFFGNETNDFLVTNAEFIEATADSSIDIYDTGSVDLVNVQTDGEEPDSISIVADGDIEVTYIYDPFDVTLEARDGSITSNENEGDANINTADLYLYATGDISGDTDFDTNFGNEGRTNFLTTNVDTLRAQADNIFILEEDGIELISVVGNGEIVRRSIVIVAEDGDISVGTVTDPDDVTLEAENGEILDADSLITTEELYLIAGNGIGTNDAIETVATEIVAESEDGDIDINNTNEEDTTATSLATGDGDILFSQSGGGSLTVTEATTEDGDIDIDVTAADLTAKTVTAGGEGMDVNLDTTTSGDVIVDDITAEDGAVIINSAGAIEENPDSDVDITAKNIGLTAEDGIGTLNAIETEGTSLALNTTNGNVDVDNSNTSATILGSLTTAIGNLFFSQSGGGALTVINAGAGTGNIEIDVDDANLTAQTVVAGGSGDVTLTTTTSGDINVDDIQAVADTVNITAFGSIFDNDLADETNLVVASQINLTAGTDIGSSEVDGDVDIDGATTDIVAGGDVFLQEANESTLNSLTANEATILAGGKTTLGTITTEESFTFRTTEGDITILTGTVESKTAGVSIQTDTGSINGDGDGPHVIAKDDSLLSTPQGTIGVAGTVDVDIDGALILDIGSNVGLTSGVLTGTIINPPGQNIPTILPASFPAPLNPPGNVFFNGVRIWPTLNSFLLSQAAGGLSTSFTFPSADQLLGGQINVFDVITSALTGPVFFYHPLAEINSDALDQFILEEDFYEFIDGRIEKNEKKKKEQSNNNGA